MIVAFFTIGFMAAIQLLCILRGRKKIVKALPLLIGLLLIGIFFTLMAWSFSLPTPVGTVEFYKQENQFAFFYIGFLLGVVNLSGGIIGWLIYGVILLLQKGRLKKEK